MELTVDYSCVFEMSPNAREENNRTHFTMRRLRQKPNLNVGIARGGKPPGRSWVFSGAAQKEEGRK